jgi:hypothetical protein
MAGVQSERFLYSVYRCYVCSEGKEKCKCSRSSMAGEGYALSCAKSRPATEWLVSLDVC